MRHVHHTRLVLFATTCAIALAASPSVQAGNGWGWQKPINQKLGLFYTSNKAFKRPKSSSRNYVRSTSYPTYTVTPTYSQVPTQATIVQRVPIQQTHVPVQTAQMQTAPGPIQSMQGGATTAPPPATVTSGVSQVVPTTRAIAPAKPIQQSTRSAAERALEILAADGVIGTTAPITTAPITTAPATTSNKGAIRMVSPESPSTAAPHPL